DVGVGSLLIAPSGRYLLTNNIEAPRFEREDGLRAQGWELVVDDWWEPSESVQRLTRGLRLGADGPYPGATDLTEDMARVRSCMTPPEVDRMRELCRLGAAAMNAAVRRVRPGQTEHEIAALLAQEATTRGVWPVVDLVATDQRIFDYRHPLPTDKRL